MQCYEKGRLLYKKMDELELFEFVVIGCVGFSCLCCICSACCKQFKRSVDSAVEGGQRVNSGHHSNSSGGYPKVREDFKIARLKVPTSAITFKTLLGAFSVITNLWMDLSQALPSYSPDQQQEPPPYQQAPDQPPREPGPQHYGPPDNGDLPPPYPGLDVATIVIRR